MAREHRHRLLRIRLVGLFQSLLVLAVIGTAVLGASLFVTLEYTARPDFCRSCHIMHPYYDSWKHSSHNQVGCIECHYDPGALETLEGKFKALSQLAKYVTRTQGTKPWAEIGDQSCMRSGCHYTRLLEDTIAFGRVKFNHRHHLLESRRGRRLRCTSCHSQIVQGSHMTVTASVCFACHFKADPEQEIRTLSDCLTCHGPPAEPIDVAGRLFDHTEYVQRGVDCQACHRAVVRGDGAVRRERCRACHGEVGHIERYGETEFLHETHVTSHKVECFECHDEIQHGLEPLHSLQPAKEGCASCHLSPHETPRLVYAGTGAAGVADRPSRMFQTRIACEACHTGRSGRPGAAAAVDCLYCHGTSYDGMLERWQGTVRAQLERLRPRLAELERRLVQEPGHPARGLLAEAQRNLRLVEQDGSAGAHNIAYALDALQASAERISDAHAALEPDAPRVAVDGFPMRVASGCSDACHLGVEQIETVALGDKRFPHRLHLLKAALDCRECHSTERHGEPAFPRDRCGSCHHKATPGAEAPECSTCHTVQAAVISGEAAGFKGEPSPMAETVGCTDCHGTPPDVVRPQAESCVLCHDDSYGPMLKEWQSTIEQLRSRLKRATGAAAARGIAAEALERARRSLDLAGRDGSRGGHNFPFTEKLLREAAAELGAE
jgi:nitrate/TMAO reductase-like tetraheme cytochrome c subunit